jgi:coenzyme F420-dependent glucose-6-phosphate dehydrogenase
VIKLGYKASAEQFAPGALLGFSCLAERVGFDSVFINDHFRRGSISTAMRRFL